MNLPKRLETAFRLASEENASAFERFANAFLLHDYPELQGIGGKQDSGMDARVLCADSGEAEIVVQSCVSPRSRARGKVLHTIHKLKDSLPHTLIYCTCAPIGVSLDETRKELRQGYCIALQVCDSTWFVQRAVTTEDRTRLCEAFVSEVLQPFLADIAPARLYSAVLSDSETRLATQYLEAHSLDRARGQNLTKGLFDALITFALRDTDPPKVLCTLQDLLRSICRMFPQGHRARIEVIVPARVKQLVSKDVLKHHRKEDGYALAFPYREKVNAHLAQLEEREILFRATLRHVVIQAMEANEIDYECDVNALVEFGTNCILWYMREQGKQLQNPLEHLLNILNTEELVSQYIARERVDLKRPGATRDVVTDIMPTALFETISRPDDDLRAYLRSKSDVFIAQAFLHATPDVQKACKKLFSQDIVFVGTTILIHCTAELYTEGSPRLLMRTLRAAQRLGIKVKTFGPFVEEFVAHLKGPVLLEWLNHFQGTPDAGYNARLRVAPRLIGVFSQSSDHRGSVERVVREIIGESNTVQNAIDFLQEEFGIVTEDIPPRGSDAEYEEWERTFGEWLCAKRRSPKMTQERFELLVRNDVNAYALIRHLRRGTQVEGDDYGHKIWLLTLDRMYWRIPRLLGKQDDYAYHVAMSMDYLVNFVAVLDAIDGSSDDKLVLPGTLIVGENDFIPGELREIVAAEWQRSDTPKYMKLRRIRELLHEVKTGGREPDPSEDIGEEITQIGGF